MYTEMDSMEATHWWFSGRRRVALDFLKRYCGKHRGRLLDIGVGTGLNAAYFQEMGFSVSGVEPSVEAAMIAQRKAPNLQIIATEFPSAEIVSGSYDVVCLLDVLEHLKDDRTAMQEVARVLSPGGKVFITVPAYRFLWSSHDERAHHFRRYRRRELRALFSDAGLRPLQVSYYNFFLFPPIALVRLVTKISGDTDTRSDFARTPAFLNSLLGHIFGAERLLLRLVSLPFGVSLIAVAEKDRAI